MSTTTAPVTPVSPSPLPPTLLTSLQSLYTTLSTTYAPTDIERVFHDRVPGFVERSLKELEARRSNRSIIESTIETLYQQHRHRFVYNPNICTFYEIGKQQMQLRVRTIDNILLELLPHIPDEMRPHRRYILRGVRSRLTQHYVFDWQPSKRCVERMTQVVKKNFGTYAEAQYLMAVVGAIVLRQEAVLFHNEHIPESSVTTTTATITATTTATPPSTTTTPPTPTTTPPSSPLPLTQPPTTATHLWHGPRVEEVVECLQRILHNHTCTFSPFWNRVKRRMHHSYRLSDVWCLYFPARPAQEDVFGVLKQSSVLFLAACCRQYREHPPLDAWKMHPTIRYTYGLNDVDALFARYVDEHVSVGVGVGTANVAPPSTLPSMATSTATSTTTSTSTSTSTSTTTSPALGPTHPTLSSHTPTPTPPPFSLSTTSLHATPPSFILFRELHHDFNDFLHTHSLPPDTVTKQDLLRLTNHHFEHVLYGTRLTKRLYRGTLTVNVRDTVHDLFLRFMQDMVVPGGESVGFAIGDAIGDTMETTLGTGFGTTVTTRQLHNNYRIWCRYYVDVPSSTLSSSHTTHPSHSSTHSSASSTTTSTTWPSTVDADHHNKPWYCSYTLFDAFLHLAASSTPATSTTTPRQWHYRIQPYKDTWKYYLDLFKREAPERTLAEWIRNEFGIVLSEEAVASSSTSSSAISSSSSTTATTTTIPLSSLTVPVLDSQDIHSIIHALQHQSHENESVLETSTLAL